MQAVQVENEKSPFIKSRDQTVSQKTNSKKPQTFLNKCSTWKGFFLLQYEIIRQHFTSKWINVTFFTLESLVVQHNRISFKCYCKKVWMRIGQFVSHKKCPLTSLSTQINYSLIFLRNQCRRKLLVSSSLFQYLQFKAFVWKCPLEELPSDPTSGDCNW